MALVSAAPWPLIVIQIPVYMRLGKDGNDDGETARKWRLDESGMPELYLCDNLMRKSHEEIQQQYVSYFAMDTIFFSVSTGLIVFFCLYVAGTRRLKALPDMIAIL
ncbi:MAG TPA: hypothetical protein VHA09_04970 [Nitrososphaera sp.]|nr:hypothetical protein [Nitrososphaera sp.]